MSNVRRMPGPARITAPRLDVRVTQEIIDAAAVRDSSHCMIAEAIAAAHPTATYIAVDLATIRFTDEAAGFRYIYLTPRPAQGALLDFDQGAKPEPFTIHARAAQVVRTGKRRTDYSAELKRVGSTDPETGELDYNGGGNALPVKVGGMTPDLGPLAHTHSRSKPKGVRTGKRRAFGLRAIIR